MLKSAVMGTYSHATLLAVFSRRTQTLIEKADIMVILLPFCYTDEQPQGEGYRDDGDSGRE